MRAQALLSVLYCVVGAAVAQDGAFDPSFNPTDQGMARFDGLHWSQQQGPFAGEGVRTMTVQPDGKLLVGGYFPGGTMGIEDPVFRPGIARLNSDGSQDATFNAGTGFDGPIEVMVVQPDGKILVGGAFLNCQGSPRKGIARLNANGTLDATFTVGTGTGGTVFEIALQPDGRILLGGNFTLYNSFPANRIVRLLATGAYDGSFATGTGFNAKVNAIALQPDGKVLVGGMFNSYQGVQRNYIARLLSTGALDAAYNDNTLVAGPDAEVTDIAIGTAGSAYIAGEFLNINGTLTGRLAKMSSAFALIPAFNGPSYPTPRMAYDPGTNILTVWGSSTAHAMAKLNGTNGDVVYGYADFQDDWHFRTSCNYLIMDWRGSTVGPSGEVYRIDAVHTGILRLNNDLTLDEGFRPGTGLGWLPLTRIGMTMSNIGVITLGGRIDLENTMPALNGTYQPDMMQLTYFGEPEASALPRAMEGYMDGVTALTLDRLVFYGHITLTCDAAGSDYVTCSLLMYDPATGTFTPMLVPGCDGPEYGPSITDVIPLASGKALYLGWDECTGASRDIGRFNLNGTWDASYTTTDLGDEMAACAAEAPDGKVYVGGDFSTANGVTRNRLVRLLANGGVDPAFDPLGGFDNRVLDIEVNPDGTIVCIGDFNHYRGTPVPHIVKLLPSGAPDPSFDPGMGIFQNPLCMVRYPDGRILIGGSIPMYDGHPVNGIVCINADGSIDETFEQGEGFRINNPTINGGTPGSGIVYDMEMQPEGRVVCMGEFHMYDGNGRNRLARIGSGTSLMVSARVFLEGAYDGSGVMTALIPRALMPLSEPYRALGFTHVRGGSESTSGSVMQMLGTGAIIDWVLVELRDPQNPTHIVATRSALLRADGWLADMDGVSPLRFYGLSMGQYHVAVRHRNHLGIMSQAPVFLGSQPIPIDFTGPNYGTYGTGAQKEVNGVRMLWAGDVNHNGTLKYAGSANDRDPILVSIGGNVPTNTVAGYRQEDVNLDGVVKYAGNANDRDRILQNIGGSVPTATRVQQLP